MLFYFGKLAEFFLQPSSLLLTVTLAAALVWHYRPQARWARRGTITGLALLLIAGISPLGNWLILPLESRYAAPDLRPPSRTIAGIIVLGGGVDSLVSRARRQLTLNEAAERVVEAIRLAHHYPDAVVILSGGPWDLLYKGTAEGAALAPLFRETGLASQQMLSEPASKNTWQNGLFVRDLISKTPRLAARRGDWLLVTSAAHMPRAMGVFNRLGIRVKPWPVDFRTRGWQDVTRPFFRPSEGLRRMDMAVHEWIGLLAYRLLGRLDFPA